MSIIIFNIFKIYFQTFYHFFIVLSQNIRIEKTIMSEYNFFMGHFINYYIFINELCLFIYRIITSICVLLLAAIATIYNNNNNNNANNNIQTTCRFVF